MQNFIATSLILFSFTPIALAQEEGDGHSDVEFSYVDGAIRVEEGEEGFVFEGEFGEDAFANFASEPGIASEIEEGAGVNAGNIIGFNVLDGLFYWDGSQVASAGDATVTIAGAGGSADVVVSATSGRQLADFAAPTNLLGQATEDGDFHVDPGFTISEGAPAGGYGLIMSLSTDDAASIGDSEPFGIFLNFGWRMKCSKLVSQHSERVSQNRRRYCSLCSESQGSARSDKSVSSHRPVSASRQCLALSTGRFNSG